MPRESTRRKGGHSPAVVVEDLVSRYLARAAVERVLGKLPRSDSRRVDWLEDQLPRHVDGQTQQEEETP